MITVKPCKFIIFLLSASECAIIINNAVSIEIGLGSTAATAECSASGGAFLYIGTEEIFHLWEL